MFKVFNNVYTSSLTTLFTKFASVHLHCTRASNYNFQLHAWKSDYVKYSIAHQGSVIWNSLSVATKLCSALHNFKCIVKFDFLQTTSEIFF